MLPVYILLLRHTVLFIFVYDVQFGAFNVKIISIQYNTIQSLFIKRLTKRSEYNER